jgi:hypothetical protein
MNFDFSGQSSSFLLAFGGTNVTLFPSGVRTKRRFRPSADEDQNPRENLNVCESYSPCHHFCLISHICISPSCRYLCVIPADPTDNRSFSLHRRLQSRTLRTLTLSFPLGVFFICTARWKGGEREGYRLLTRVLYEGRWNLDGARLHMS